MVQKEGNEPSDEIGPDPNLTLKDDSLDHKLVEKPVALQKFPK